MSEAGPAGLSGPGPACAGCGHSWWVHQHLNGAHYCGACRCARYRAPPRRRRAPWWLGAALLFAAALAILALAVLAVLLLPGPLPPPP